MIERLKVRRRQATAAFCLAMALGAGASIYGLISDAGAARVEKMAIFLTFFLSALFAVVSWYWGLGSSESRGFMGGAYDNFRKDPIERARYRRKRHGLDEEEDDNAQAG